MKSYSRTEVKVIDFGSAAKLTSDPYTSFRGTDVYIPPEFYLHSKYYAFSASVWAIGCLAFILLAGDCPFQSVDAIRRFDNVTDIKEEYGERTIRLNFIRSLLNPNPDERILISDLLIHPWLKTAA